MVEGIGRSGGFEDIARHFGLADFKEAMRRSEIDLFGPGAAARAEAVMAESIAVAMAAGPKKDLNTAVAELSADELAAVRLCVVEGRSATAASTVLFVDRSTVSKLLHKAERSLGITGPGDWAPALKALLQSGWLSGADAAMAISHLTGQGEAAPAKTWDALLGQLGRLGVPAAEMAVLRWHAACGGLGLRGVERDMLAAIARGEEKTVVDDVFGGSRTNTRRQSLAAKLGNFTTHAGQELTLPTIAAAAFLGVLPPDHDVRTVAVARVHTHAATLGQPLTAGQVGLLLDVAGGMDQTALVQTHGSNELTLMALKLWTALDVPGKWDRGRNTAALIDRAAQLGLLDAAAPAGAGTAPEGLIDPRTVEAPPRAAAPARAALNPEAIPSVKFGTDTLTQAEIIAAPSVADPDLGLYRLWQVQRLPERECPQGVPGTASVGHHRRQLAERLGNPEPREFLAITARAVAEGKLNRADLQQAQRWAGADLLGLRRDDVRAIVALAEGCTPAQVATMMQAAIANTRTRLKQIGDRLGIPGSAVQAEVRQAIVDVAFQHGMFKKRPIIGAEPPVAIAPTPQPRGLPGIDHVQVSYGGRPIRKAEILAAPSIEPRFLERFRSWKVLNLSKPEWIPAGLGPAGNAKTYIATVLGNPDARGFLAIAAKAAQRGQLTTEELLQAERWAAVEFAGLTRPDLPLIDAIARSPTIEEAAVNSGVSKNYFYKRLLEITKSLDLPSVASGPGAPQQLLDALYRLGVFREEPRMPMFETEDVTAYSPALQQALLRGQAVVGVDGVLVEAVKAGLLMSREQAGLVFDLAQQRPIAEITAAYGPGFDADVATLATMLEVEEVRPVGRLLQSVIEAARDEGLIAPLPWPDPLRAPAGYSRLMQERFDLGPDLVASLLVLSSQPRTIGPEARLTAMAESLGTDAASAQTRVIDLASRLCRDVPGAVMAPGAQAIRTWAGQNGVGPDSLPAEVAAAAGFTLDTAEMALIDAAFRLSGASLYPDAGGRGTVQMCEALAGLEERLGLPSSRPGLAEALAPVVLQAVRERGVL